MDWLHPINASCTQIHGIQPFLKSMTKYTKITVTEQWIHPEFFVEKTAAK
jgi:hypothetical protein